jgi:GNAT superfamily N-acetyltransferase
MIQENLIAYFRLFAGLPGITFIDQDVTWTASVSSAPGNQVLRTRLSGSSGAIERRIDELIAQFGQHADQIDWLVFPGDQPADLGQRLEARGMPGSLGGIWMLADLTAPSSAPAVPDGFHIQPVRDAAALATWSDISTAGFGDNTQIFYDAYARHGFGRDAYSLHYVGYLGDRPVTSSTLLLAGGIASVYDVSTPPAFRRQGFGGAITFATLQEARLRGYRDAWIWSSQMGKGVYSRLGFVAGDFGVREYRWRKP